MCIRDSHYSVSVFLEQGSIWFCFIFFLFQIQEILASESAILSYLGFYPTMLRAYTILFQNEIFPLSFFWSNNQTLTKYWKWCNISRKYRKLWLSTYYRSITQDGIDIDDYTYSEGNQQSIHSRGVVIPLVGPISAFYIRTKHIRAAANEHERTRRISKFHDNPDGNASWSSVTRKTLWNREKKCYIRRTFHYEHSKL